MHCGTPSPQMRCLACLSSYISFECIVIEQIAHCHGIRLLLRNAGECSVDNDRVLAVLMTKFRDQHRRIVVGSGKQWRFRTWQWWVLDWRSVSLRGGVLLVRMRWRDDRQHNGYNGRQHFLDKEM